MTKSYRLKNDGVFYILQKKRKFLWISYWSTISYNKNYDKIQNEFLEFVKNE